MKKKRRVIHVVKHKMTGAKIPMKVNAIDENNIITDAEEVIDERKAFNLEMLIDRWSMKKDDIIAMLMAYQIPGHLQRATVDDFREGQMPIDRAIFFEEYIYALEKKASLPHAKIKSRIFK